MMLSNKHRKPKTYGGPRPKRPTVTEPSLTPSYTPGGSDNAGAKRTIAWVIVTWILTLLGYFIGYLIAGMGMALTTDTPLPQRYETDADVLERHKSARRTYRLHAIISCPVCTSASTTYDGSDMHDGERWRLFTCRDCGLRYGIRESAFAGRG